MILTKDSFELTVFSPSFWGSETLSHLSNVPSSKQQEQVFLTPALCSSSIHGTGGPCLSFYTSYDRASAITQAGRLSRSGLFWHLERLSLLQGPNLCWVLALSSGHRQRRCSSGFTITLQRSGSCDPFLQLSSFHCISKACSRSYSCGGRILTGSISFLGVL